MAGAGLVTAGPLARLTQTRLTTVAESGSVAATTVWITRSPIVPGAMSPIVHVSTFPLAPLATLGAADADAGILPTYWSPGGSVSVTITLRAITPFGGLS